MRVLTCSVSVILIIGALTVYPALGKKQTPTKAKPSQSPSAQNAQAIKDLEQRVKELEQAVQDNAIHVEKSELRIKELESIAHDKAVEGDTIGWTTLLAIYGSGLATYSLIAKLQEKRRRVKVRMYWGFLAGGPSLGSAMLFIQASNPGSRNVTIQTPGILLPNGQQMIFPKPASNVTFPHQLIEGTECSIWTPIGALSRQFKEEGLRGKIKLVGFCKDQVGATYKGKKFILDIDQWIRREAL